MKKRIINDWVKQSKKCSDYNRPEEMVVSTVLAVVVSGLAVSIANSFLLLPLWVEGAVWLGLSVAWPTWWLAFMEYIQKSIDEATKP